MIEMSDKTQNMKNSNELPPKRKVGRPPKRRFQKKDKTMNPTEELQMSSFADEMRGLSASSLSPNKPDIEGLTVKNISDEQLCEKSVRKVVGATDSGGGLRFLIEMVDRSRCVLEAERAYVLYPEAILKFFESNIVWNQ